MIRRVVSLALVATLALTGCSGGDDDREVVTVFAAASLTEALTQLAADFETEHDNFRVELNFASSATLAQQINEGAPADAFIPAGLHLVSLIPFRGEPLVIASNEMVIAVPEGNPHGITTLADLARPDLKVALCVEQAPCGTVARAALAQAGIKLAGVTLEPDVKATLTKLRLGEVDAVMVYRTDVLAAAGEVAAIEFAEAADHVNEYSLVMLRETSVARAFAAYVASAQARKVLSDHGFTVPVVSAGT